MARSPATPITIRPERAGDVVAIRRLHDRAFDGPEEGTVVDALRATGKLLVSLVAELEGRVVGHVALSEVTVEPPRGSEGTGHVVIGLGPLAVLPEHQGRGVGSRLVRDGLERVTEAGYTASVVVGHPEYYPRFGYRPASCFRLEAPSGVPEEAFMALELVPGALAGPGGVVRYAEEFADV